MGYVVCKTFMFKYWFYWNEGMVELSFLFIFMEWKVGYCRSFKVIFFFFFD